MKGWEKEPLKFTVKSSFMYKIHLFDGPVVMLEEGLKQSREEEVGGLKIMHVSTWLRQGTAQVHPVCQSQGWWMLRPSA